MMKNTYGFSYMEILVSLSLMSLLLAAFLTTEWVVMREARGAYYFALALNQAKMLTEARLDVNVVDAVGLDSIFKESVAEMLPAGDLKVQEVDGKKMVTIVWGGERVEKCKQSTLSEKGCLAYVFEGRNFN